MPVLQADDRIPKIGKPSDVALLLAGCEGANPEDLRDRALVWLLYSRKPRRRHSIRGASERLEQALDWDAVVGPTVCLTG